MDINQVKHIASKFTSKPYERKLVEQSEFALGRMDSISIFSTEKLEMIITLYTMLESIHSYKMEGIECSIPDILFYKLGLNKYIEYPIDDVKKIYNYYTILDYERKHIKNKNNKIYSKVIKRVFNKLSLNNSDLKINTKNIKEINDLLGNKDSYYPISLAMAIIYGYIEINNLFNDYNGKMCRIINNLILFNNKMLNNPFLCLSIYFNLYREEYYDMLSDLKKYNHYSIWECWFEFFLYCLIETIKEQISMNQQYANYLASTEPTKYPLFLINSIPQQSDESMVDIIKSDPCIKIFNKNFQPILK